MGTDDEDAGLVALHEALKAQHARVESDPAAARSLLLRLGLYREDERGDLRANLRSPESAVDQP